MENRNGLAVDCIVTPATGTAEREAALKMLATAPQAKTVGADKGYDVADFVTACREQGVTPHAADVKLVVAWMVKFMQSFSRLDLSPFDDLLSYRVDPDSSELPRRVASCA